MTKDQKTEIQAIGRKLQSILPGFYGSIQFNLAVNKPVNVNMTEDCGDDITVKENLKL